MNPKELLNKYYHFAVIGVTTNEEKFGYKIYKRLLDRNYDAVGVSPIYNEIDGKKVYPSLMAIDQPIDVVVFVANKKFAYDYVDQMSALGIHYAWMQPNTYDDDLLAYMKNLGIIPILACILVETSI